MDHLKGSTLEYILTGALLALVATSPLWLYILTTHY